MKILFGLTFFLVFQGTQLFGHEGHEEGKQWIQWLGNIHLLLLHFPIAFILGAVIAEWLSRYSNRKVENEEFVDFYDKSAEFMIAAAAITIIPTIIFGFALGYDANYEGIYATYFWWHQFCGLLTGALAISAWYYRVANKRVYYVLLGFLALGVVATGFFGGGLSFGPDHLLPPA